VFVCPCICSYFRYSNFDNFGAKNKLLVMTLLENHDGLPFKSSSSYVFLIEPQFIFVQPCVCYYFRYSKYDDFRVKIKLLVMIVFYLKAVPALCS
jgi:hypothetical protein